MTKFYELFWKHVLTRWHEFCVDAEAKVTYLFLMDVLLVVVIGVVTIMLLCLIERVWKKWAEDGSNSTTKS